MVMVDKDVMKPLCVRMPIKYGHMLEPDDKLTCEQCKIKGWAKSLGRIGTPVETDKHGRFIAREAQIT